MIKRVDVRGRKDRLADVVATLRPRATGTGDVRDAVRGILAEVRDGGDEALYRLTERFDGCDLREAGLAVPPEAVAQASNRISGELYQALEEAGGRIEAYQRNVLASIPEKTSFERSGVYVADLRRPVARAGIYAPGGRFSYPSTVLMTAIPARVAGVKEVVLCVPPGPDGTIADASLAAARIAGVDSVFRIGGAQAIGAMAFGTESVPRVDLIAGPGNIYVSEAKREVFGEVGIDVVAGPSELVIIADDGADPSWIAIDLIAQAEHGPDGACAVFVWSEAEADRIAGAIDAELDADGRPEVRENLEAGGAIVIAANVKQAVELSNLFAPEHLQLMVDDPGTLLETVTSAGAVFLGYRTPAPYGDYVAGPDHVLPTGGAARYASALSVADFIRRMHAVEFAPLAIESVGLAAETIGEAEGMSAHVESARRRRLSVEEGR